ncbi:mitochondrial 2-enoyl thioester reductase, partial [Peltigera leucophlebia]|nr:mitochondrial 2-enoyl thioester reductase [Peltigera leucophlebia]
MSPPSLAQAILFFSRRNPHKQTLFQRCRAATSKLPRIPARTISTFGYHQAKALVYSSHGQPSAVLNLQTHSISPPHSHLLTLRTLSAPINPSDINQIQGTYPLLPSLPATPGNEACFQVVATGSLVKSVAAGDWVLPLTFPPGLGTWRTHIQVPEDIVMKVDEKQGLDHTDVSTVGINPITAWVLLKGLEARDGDWVVLNAANSGVGRAVVQLGKLWGIKTLAIVRKREEDEAGSAMVKKELEELGATKVIFDTELGTAGKKGFEDQLHNWTGGEQDKIKLGLNSLGGREAHLLSKCVHPGGSVITYGNMNNKPLSLSAGSLIFRDLSFRGFWLSKWAERHPTEKIKTINKIL